MIIEKTFGEKLAAVLRQILPTGIALVSAVFMGTQTRVPGLASVLPDLPLIVVYYWSVVRPQSLGAGSAFAIGILQDLVTGLPLGLSAMALVATRIVIARQSRFFIGKSFWVYWWGYAVVVLAVGLRQWLLALVVLGLKAPILQVLAAAVLGFGVFPLVYWLCDRIERHVLAED